MKKSILAVLATAITIAAIVAIVFAQTYGPYVSPPYTRNNNPVVPSNEVIYNSATNDVPSSSNWVTTSVPANGAWYVMMNVTFSKVDSSAQVLWQCYESNDGGSTYTIAIGSSISTTYSATAGVNSIFPTPTGLQSGNPDWSSVAATDGKYVVKASITPA